jgi:hypothetical protein
LSVGYWFWRHSSWQLQLVSFFWSTSTHEMAARDWRTAVKFFSACHTTLVSNFVWREKCPAEPETRRAVALLFGCIIFGF